MEENLFPNETGNQKTGIAEIKIKINGIHFFDNKNKQILRKYLKKKI